jgi:hypothetical protein
MERNDLSSDPVPRCAIVFEGALAWLPDARAEKEFNRLAGRGKWDDAVDLFEFNEKLEVALWDRSWRKSLQFDVVTFLGPDDWAAAVARRIGDEELPVHKVWASTPKTLARRLAYMPELVRVYHAYPQYQLYFGQKGRYLTDANQLGY